MLKYCGILTQLFPFLFALHLLMPVPGAVLFVGFATWEVNPMLQRSFTYHQLDPIESCSDPFDGYLWELGRIAWQFHQDVC